MARPPLPEKVLVERFGPHPSYVPPGGWSEQAPPDRLVKTHCCFCGGRRLECPCHEGYFSVEDGRVLQGPPPRPLPRIVLERRGNEVWAVGVDSGSSES